MRKLSLLMAVIVLFSCFNFSVFAEEIAEVIEKAETIAEEVSEETAEEAVEEEVPKEEPLPEEEPAEEDFAELNAVDYAVLDETASAITAEMLTSGNEPCHMVTRNLDMSLAGDIVIPDGVTVTFKSSDTSVIKDDGTVERSFEGDKTVTVTATVSDGETGVEKAFEFTVLKANTLVLHSDNFYYPEALDEEIVTYSNSTKNYVSNLPGAWKYGPYTGNPLPNASSKIKIADGEYVVSYTRMNSEAGSETNLYVPINIAKDAPNYSKIKFSMTLKPITYTPATQRIDFTLLANNAKFIDWFSFKSGSIQNNLQSPTEYISQTNTGFNTSGDNRIDVIIDYEAGTYTNVVNGNEQTPLRIPSGMETLKLNYFTIGLARWQINPAQFYIKDMAVTTEVDLTKVRNVASVINSEMFDCENADSVFEDFSFSLGETFSTYLEEKGITVSFASDNPLIEVNGHNFTVTPSETKETVTVTATISDGEETAQKEFTFRVYNPASIIIEKITTSNFTCPDTKKIREDFSFAEGSEVEGLLFEYGAVIEISSNSSAIVFDGYNASITQTEDVQETEVTVSVTAGNITVEKTFEMNVQNILLADVFAFDEPTVTDDGSTYSLTTSVTCVDSISSTAEITLVAVLTNKTSGKIADVGYDTKTVNNGGTVTLEAEVNNLGADYECKYYIWNNIEDAVPVKNAPPAEPLGASVSEETTGSGLITWKKAEDDGKAVASYNIYRAGNLIGTTDGLDYRSENLDFGTEYVHTIKSVDEAGNESLYGTDVILKTKSIPTVTLKSDNPEQPGNVQDAPELKLITVENPGPYSYTEVAEIGGRICRKTTKHIRADGTIVVSMFFFKADSKYITPGTKNIAIEITYFDNGTFNVINESQGGGGGSFKLTNTGCWKTRTLTINSAAYTANGLYDGANFRYYTQGAENFHVYQTSISRLDEYSQPAASFKVDDVIVLRDVLYYAADNQATVTEIGERTAAQVDFGKFIELDFEDFRVDSSMSDLTVEVEYFDGGMDDINVEYSSTDGPKTYSFAKTNTGKWMTKIINLSDAKFDASVTGVTNRKVDMRVSGASETLYIKTIKAY